MSEKERNSDELDDAIANADDTGMVAQQQEIAEEEIEEELNDGGD